MSAAASEETFLCSICLEVFSEPVSTPCGHNFCKRCISQAWDTHGPCTCPLCNRTYDTGPQLTVNTLLSEMVSQFKLEAEKSKSQLSKPGEVSCDFCSEPKVKASKSCLVCLSSFCETHLQPHLTVSGLKGHQLTEPVDNLEDRMCPTHRRPLELFCDTDQSCVCTICVLLQHKNHELVSLEEGYERRRSSLQYTQAQSQHMVEQRRLKLQEIQRCLELSETEFDTERSVGLQAFSALMQSVQRRLDRFLEELQEKQSRSHRRAQELVQQLEQEICELEKSSTEAEQLLCTQEDHLHFLQRCPALMPPAGLKEWSRMSFEPETCESSAAQALSELEKHLSEEFTQLLKAELQKRQQFAVDVTLDPNTAQSRLVLSEDLKEVYHSNTRKNVPDNIERFSQNPIVLGKQRFSSGRFYYEVNVEKKTKWELGVVKNSISRKGPICLSPQNGHWTIQLRNDIYRANDDPPVDLSPRQAPQKVGVFVDYDVGLISFYDADCADLLYSFTHCSFTESLLPLFSPSGNGGDNSAPLIITPV